MSDRKEYFKQLYQDNKEAYKESNRRNKRVRTDENIAWRNDYLAEHPCVDCGESDSRVLQFDHVRGKKSMALSRMWTTGYALERCKKEVEKCDVRCANCHAIRTSKQQQWNK